MTITPDRTNPLREFGDVFEALDRLPFPVFAIASNGLIRWLNMAGEDIVGDVRGEHFSRLVAPQSKGVVAAAFASKVVGSRRETVYDAVLLTKDGEPLEVEICSVTVNGGDGIVGVFGAIHGAGRQASGAGQAVSDLTPRQAEVLGYLVRGYKTEEMAERMGLSRETVRNHVRGVLHRLGVHSRLEAVAIARMRGLV